MVYSQGDTATSTFTSAVPVPSSQGTSSSSAYLPPPNQVSAYDPHSGILNPDAALNVPVSSGKPSSLEADLTSRPSSAGVSTPQAILVPGSNHSQQITTGGDSISDEHILLVEQQLLAAAMDVKDFQFQFQDLNQTQLHNQLFQEQLDELLLEQAQTLAQSQPQAPAQAQVEIHTQAQAQIQAQIVSPHECPEYGDSLMNESDVGTKPTLYPGAIHQEQLRNYRGYRHYSYDHNGAPQPVLSNQGGNGFPSSSSSSSSSSLASSSSTQQQQPAVGHQQQLAFGLPLPPVDSSHSSPSISPGAEQILTQAQMQLPALQLNSSHRSPLDGPGIGNPSATQIQAHPLQVDASHDSLETGTTTGTTTPQSSLAAQAYMQTPLTAVPSASASAASSIVGTPTEINNLQSLSNLPDGSSSSNEQQQQSNNDSNDNGTFNIVGTNNRRPAHLPPPFAQEHDIYYGFSFEPVEDFIRPSSWPSLVSGVPSTATGTANTTVDQELKEFLDSVGGDIKYATAQLELYGDMSISDAFLPSKVDPRLSLTTGVSGTGTGGVVDPKIQPGDDVVVVVKREKKSLLDVDFDPANTAAANSDVGKGADRDNAIIPITVRKAAAVAARAAAIAARESTINEYINLSLTVEAQSGNKNNHGHNRRSRDNVVAGQGNNNRSDGSEHPHHRNESVADVNDAGNEEYFPLPPSSPTPPPPTRPAPTPTTRQNTRSRVSKKGSVQKTSPTPEPTVFKCEIPHCEKEFSTFGLLKSHKVSHDPEKPYWCDICSEDGITPRPADPTPLFPGMPIPIPEVKKYKRHHDLLRHKREQHPPLAVKIQRFREKLEAKEARRVKAEETRRIKAALKRAEKAAAQAANPTTASRRRPSSAATTSAASRRRISLAATTTATAAPRGRRASSTTAAIAAIEAIPAVAAPGLPDAPKAPRKRKLTETKRSTTDDNDEDEVENDSDSDSDYQENTKKRRRSKTSSISRIIPATPRRRRSSAGQTQPQHLHQENGQASSASSGSAIVNLVNTTQIQGPGKNQYRR
ncbi:MAG: hypothetical protein JOS17DRAFT_760681 [Linnemannia elongata]|nr:MAG: hypothetical protein JOS17DRAFT_760681 [Linnemannia elongata]